MFLSKIWFFLVALIGAIAFVIALVLPRPAQRAVTAEEQQRLAVACTIVNILLTDNATARVDLAGSMGRTPEIVDALAAASAADKLDDARMKQVRQIAETTINAAHGVKPDFAMFVDHRGRVVARTKIDQDDFGDLVTGRPLVDDALAGYLRDDLWAQNGTLYLVAAAPIIKRDAPVTYEGAVVLGYTISKDQASQMVASLNVDVGFFLGDADVAASKSLGFDHKAMLAAASKLTDGDRSRDCLANQPLDVPAGKDMYTAIVARLPGEAESKHAFYSVFIKKPDTIGFMATLHAVRQGDLSFANFPWFLFGGGFVVALAIGILLMFWEADGPLRKLTEDAVKLGKGETERLAEDAHKGRFGSIARSVNIQIDKIAREAKTAKKDMDQLLGPAPEGSLGTIDLLATALPSVRPGGPGPASPAPPSDFKFDSGNAHGLAGSANSLNRPAPAAIPAAPPRPAAAPAFAPPATPVPQAKPPIPTKAPSPPLPLRPPTPTPVAVQPAAAKPGLSLDDDILGGDHHAAPAAPMAPTPSGNTVDPYFNQVFEQFVAVKKSCGEPTAGLTYTKFSEKLVKNREDLMAKTGCKEVRFTVYVKDGKAALKATPVKDE